MNNSKQLRELILIISEFGSKSPKSLFYSLKKKTQLGLLAKKFNSATDDNERRWAINIVGADDEHDHRYIRLRSKLKRRLMTELFSLDLRVGSELRKATYQSAKDLFTIRILIMLGARKTAIWLIPRALKRAQKYELTQDQIELLLFSRQDAALNGDRAKFERISKELTTIVSIRNTELKLQSLSDEIDLELVARAQPTEIVKNLSIASAKEAQFCYNLFPTFNIGLHYLLMASQASEISEKTARTFHLCDKAEELFERFPHLSTPLYRGEFTLKRLTTAISIRNFEAARNAIQRCENIWPEGRNNWFIWKESEFLFLLHTNCFPQAYALHQKILHHRRFFAQPEQVKEKWALFKQYSTLALEHETPSIKYSFNRILKDVPIYRRDKGGYNAALVILQHLILLSKGDFVNMLKKSDSIMQYNYRYLRERHHTQLYAFFKTILILEKTNFNIQETKIQAEKFIEQFSKYGLDKINEAQTLPFDLMWSWIIGWVEKWNYKILKTN
jgi:hypothetical protein